jgi:hypothetical protein
MPLSSSNTYKAPFCKIEDPRYTPVRRGYIVNSFPGHTLEQHSTAVGRDMQPHVGRVIPIRSEDRLYYTGYDIDGKLLDLIKIDKGVKSVREECQGQWPQGWNEGEEGILRMFAVTGYSAPD